MSSLSSSPPSRIIIIPLTLTQQLDFVSVFSQSMMFQNFFFSPKQQPLVSLIHALSLSLSLSHTHTHTHSLDRSLIHSLTYSTASTCTLAHSLLTHSLLLAHSFSFTHSLANSLTYSLTRTHARTRLRRHALLLTYARTHPCTHAWNNASYRAPTNLILPPSPPARPHIHARALTPVRLG